MHGSNLRDDGFGNFRFGAGSAGSYGAMWRLDGATGSYGIYLTNEGGAEDAIAAVTQVAYAHAPDMTFYTKSLSNRGAARFSGIGTTAAAANAYWDSGASNSLLWSTSSERYKCNIEALDPSIADRVIRQAKPIWYRSKAPADRPDWSWYGFCAEDIANIDPRLVH